jgi:hypothetical protein
MLHRYSHCSEQRHTVTEELFQANVEDSIICKQLVHDGHIKTVSTTDTV